MFSGNCFVNQEGRPTMCYHQVGQGNAMAVALDDELNTWEKLASNPITPKHPARRSVSRPIPLLGSVRLARRRHLLRHLRRRTPRPGQSPLPRRPVAGTSATCSPTPFPASRSAKTFPAPISSRLGNRHVLLCISHRLGARYYLGDWKNEQFHPTFHERMSWVDNSFFAPESLLDDRGRRIMWAWIFDQPEFKMRTDYGWSGTMSLPRVLTLAEDGTLRMNPPESELAIRLWLVRAGRLF